MRRRMKWAREAVITYKSLDIETPVISGPESLEPLLLDIAAATVEHFYVFALDTKNKVIARYLLSKGTMTSSTVDTRELFRFAVLSNAVGLVLAHNHPSGDIEPSPMDIEVTQRIVAAADVLGFVVLDHVIVTDTRMMSFASRGIMPTRKYAAT